MPTTCVAFGCNNVSNLEKGIALHIIPFFGDDHAESRKRRKKCVVFIKARQAHWKPTKQSAVCSVHFKPEDFQRLFIQDCRELTSNQGSKGRAWS